MVPPYKYKGVVEAGCNSVAADIIPVQASPDDLIESLFDLIRRPGDHPNLCRIFTIYLRRRIAMEILPIIGDVFTLQVETTFSQSRSSGFPNKTVNGVKGISNINSVDIREVMVRTMIILP